MEELIQSIIRERAAKLQNSKPQRSETTSASQLESNSALGKSRYTHPFPLCHIYNDVNTDSLVTPKISFEIQDELVGLARDGQIKVDYNFLLNRIMKVFFSIETF